jgi:hypothetical protein
MASMVPMAIIGSAMGANSHGGNVRTTATIVEDWRISDGCVDASGVCINWAI